MGNHSSTRSSAYVFAEFKLAFSRLDYSTTDRDETPQCIVHILADKERSICELDIVKSSSGNLFSYSVSDAIPFSPGREPESIGTRIWPGSVALTQWILANREIFQNKRVIELGCGVGLPGIAIAKFCGPSQVVLTDKAELEQVVTKSINSNNLSVGNVQFEPFDWGSGSDLKKFSQLPADLVVASEVVYVEEQEPLVNALMAVAPTESTTVILAYTSRSDEDQVYLDTRILNAFDVLSAITTNTRYQILLLRRRGSLKL